MEVHTSNNFTLRDLLVVASTSGASILNVFLGGAIFTALPTIGQDLNFRQADLQWPFNVYTLAYGCLLLLFGRIGDIVGGRIMFMTGILWFSIWSIAAAFAPGVVTFIIFCGCQGLGAAAFTPASIRLITSHFPPGRKRNNAIAIFGAGQPVGYIIGLVIGGVLAGSKATWRSIFYIQAGLGVVFSVIGWMAIGKATDTKLYDKGLDLGGAFLSTVGIALLTYSLADSTTSIKGWGEPRIPALFALSIVVLVCFVLYEMWREKKDLSVLMPPSMWNKPGAKLSSFTLLMFFAWWSYNSIEFLLNLYLQQVKLYSPRTTALYLLPTAIAGITVNLVAGFAMSHVPGRYINWIGLALGAAAPIIYALMKVDSNYWAMAFLALITVVGADAVYPIANLQVVSSFDDDSQALAGGIFSVATRVGTSIGLAVTTAIATSVSRTFNESHPDLLPDSPLVLLTGFKAAAWSCLAASSISLLISFTTLRKLGIVGASPVPDSQETTVQDIEASPKPSVAIETISEKFQQEEITNLNEKERREQGSPA